MTQNSRAFQPMSRRRLLELASVGGAGLALGLHGSEAQARQESDAQTLVVGRAAAEPVSLDPAVATSSESVDVILQTYEPLLMDQPGSTDMMPVLATDYDVSEDGKTWTFRIRDGVTFPDGTPVDANAVAYSVDRLAQVGQGFAFVLSGIYDRAEAVDATTARIYLSNPSGPFLATIPKIFIVNPALVEAHKTADDPHATKYLYDHPEGTGPYRLESWEHSQQVTLARRDDYWGTAPAIPRIVIREVSDWAQQRLLLERGDIDIAAQYIVTDLPTLGANSDIRIEEHPSLVELYICMQHKKGPTEDVRVRQALAAAFDYQGYIDGIYQGHAVQPQGVLPREMAYHDDTLPIEEQDIEKARSLLADAGLADGTSLEYLYVTGDKNELGAGQVLQAALQQLNVQLQMQEVSWTILLGRFQDEPNAPDTYGYYVFPPYNDPDAVLFSMFHTSNQGLAGYNGFYAGSPEMDEMLIEARTTLDTDRRAELYKQLQMMIYEDASVIPVANPNSIILTRSWVSGYQYRPTWHNTINYQQLAFDGKP
jgi:peptide/nickel transport system substrate-binding protein